MSAPHSEAPADDETDGLAALRRRKGRTPRVAPAPRHPRPSAAVVAAAEPTAEPPRVDAPAPPPAPVPEVTAETSREVAREVEPETSREIAVEIGVAPPAAVRPVREPVTPASATPAPAAARAVAVSAPAGPPAPVPLSTVPALDVDLSDPAGLLPSPTVLSVPGSVMRRFDAARERAASHTGLVLDALRAHAGELPALVLAGRPGARPDDLFPWRQATAAPAPADRPEPLRVRPTVGELGVIDQLVRWVSQELATRRPGSRKASRSEVVTAALRAYLPPPAGRGR